MAHEVETALEELRATVQRGESTAAVLQDAQWALEVAKQAGVLATTEVAASMGDDGHFEPLLRFVAEHGSLSTKNLPLGQCRADDLSEVAKRYGCLEPAGKNGWKAIAPRPSSQRRAEKVTAAARCWAVVTLIRGDAAQRARFAEQMASMLRADHPESRFHRLHPTPGALAVVGQTDVAFIDDVENLPVAFQTELLQHLHTSSSKVIVGASQPLSSIQEKVRLGQWREDLFYRIRNSFTPIDVTAHEVPLAR